MDLIYLISVFVHILAAAFWIGGMVFLAFVLLPAINDHPERSALFHKVAVRFRAAGHAALGLLLITGLFNMHARGISFNPAEMTGSFQGMMTLKKLGIFVLIFFVSYIHDKHVGKKALQNDIENKPDNRTLLLARWMGRLNLILALAAVALGIIIVRGW